MRIDSGKSLRVQIWLSWLASWAACWWIATWLTVTLLTEAHPPATAALAVDRSKCPGLLTLVDAASTGTELASCWACKLPLLLLLLWCDGLDTDPWPLSRSCQCSVIRIVFICQSITTLVIAANIWDAKSINKNSCVVRVYRSTRLFLDILYAFEKQKSSCCWEGSNLTLPVEI